MSDMVIKSTKEAKKLERHYMTNSSRILYTALEDLNFHWDHDQVKEFKQMWKKGFSIQDMAEYFERPEEEIAVLIIDRAMKESIKPRQGGIWGNGNQSAKTS